jgi:hypothetical protein
VEVHRKSPRDRHFTKRLSGDQRKLAPHLPRPIHRTEHGCHHHDCCGPGADLHITGKYVEPAAISSISRPQSGHRLFHHPFFASHRQSQRLSSGMLPP